MSALDLAFLPRKFGVELGGTELPEPWHVVTPRVGWYFTGIVEGEGCFYIKSDKSACACHFALRLRVDDAPLLEWLRGELGGIGRIVTVTNRSPNQAPLSDWRVTKRREAVWLTELFDAYPLRGKKARDYEVWREAVIDWSAGAGKAELEEYRAKLKLARAYVPLEVSA